MSILVTSDQIKSSFGELNAEMAQAASHDFIETDSHSWIPSGIDQEHQTISFVSCATMYVVPCSVTPLGAECPSDFTKYQDIQI